MAEWLRGYEIKLHLITPIMNFRTEIHINPSANRISHQTPMVLIGSCFTEYIGCKLRDLCFPVFLNPCGIVYNPISVSRSLEIMIAGKEFTGEDLAFFNDLWFSFDHHTSFSHPERDSCLEKINRNILEGSQYLRKAKFLLISFGTSRVYIHKKLEKVVSNCHKIPSAEFEQRMLSVDEIIELTRETMKKIVTLNPELKFIFTLSPVRHWKDGATGNQLSKATLLLAIDKLVKEYPDITEYFPAYELMLDDLRDYRYYADDLLHPGTQAVQYIWEKFSDTCFDEKTMTINNELNSLNNAMKHRPFNKNTPAMKKFLDHHKLMAENLCKKYPFIDFQKYIEYFS